MGPLHGLCTRHNEEAAFELKLISRLSGIKAHSYVVEASLVRLELITGRDETISGIAYPFLKCYGVTQLLDLLFQDLVRSLQLLDGDSVLDDCVSSSVATVVFVVFDLDRKAYV